MMEAGMHTPKVSWHGESIKQAGQLLEDAKEVRDLAINKTGLIVGFNPPQKLTACDKLQNDCFHQNMISLLNQIAVVVKEIKHELERL